MSFTAQRSYRPLFARIFLTLSVTLFAVTWVVSAWAAIRTEVSARKVGVGQPIVVSITYVQGEGDPAPQNPNLKVQGAAEVRGPSISTQSRVMMNNFNFTSEKSVVARYQVTPSKEGKLVIGPGSFSVGGKVENGEVVTVEVVPADQVPQARRRRDPFGNSPFSNDPFFKDLLDNDPDSDAFDQFMRRRHGAFGISEAPPEYQLDKAADPIAFLHAVLSSRSVVVGEPVRLTILAYGARGDFGEQSLTEPGLGDFLTYRALDNSQAEPPYRTEISGQTYIVRKLREYIIVPLKTGDLSIGKMTTVLQNPRHSYPQHKSQLGFSTETLPLTLHVTEPPERGRPSGYLLGDVGRYQVSATVSPREVTHGEFAEILVTVRGEGAIPSQVILPESKGLLWEAPTIKGGPEVRDGVLQGERTLKYPLQLKQSGEIELGAITLPYYDHKSGRYNIARADLGKIVVKPSATAALPSDPTAAPSALDSDTGSSTTLSRPLPPRAAALPFQKAETSVIRPVFWYLLFGIPVGLWLVASLWGSALHLRKQRSEDVKFNWKAELKNAQEFARKGQGPEALRSLEKVLFEGITHKTGLLARGILQSELKSSLLKEGISGSLASDIEQFLKEAESARFGGQSVDVEPLVTRASQLAKSLFAGKATKNKEARS